MDARASKSGHGAGGLRSFMLIFTIPPSQYPTQARQLVEDDRDHCGHLLLDTIAAESWIFLPPVGPWDRLGVNDPVGVIRHFDSRMLSKLRSQKAARVLLLRAFLRVRAGKLFTLIVEIDDRVEGQQ